MTPAEQELNVAMCEWRGWRRYPDPGFTEYAVYHPLGEFDQTEVIPVGKLPNHIDDLNAVHEAEKGLTLDQRESYESRLYYECEKLKRMAPIRFLCITADAKTKTIALLTVVNPTFIKAWKQKYPNE